MTGTKELKRRIRSIRSTRQITRAMEMVSAAKMRKAQAAALNTRTYAHLSWELIQNLGRKAHPRLHRLLRTSPKEIKRVGIVLMSSNRGLIGSFNNQIVSAALNYAKGYPDAEFITVGKKGRDAVRKMGFNIIAEFEKRETAASIADLMPMARLVIEDFVSGKYDKVVLVYMDFVNTLRQKPNVRELLPLVSTPDTTLGQVGGFEPESSTLVESDYLFEPSPDDVLEVLLPRLTEMQIYQAFLETVASEHSARMVTMKNASDAASDLILELTLEFNQLRQEAITKEISEIVSGKLALS